MGEIIKHPGLTGPVYTAPEPIAQQHDVSRFDCGKVPLNDWLQIHAIKSEGRSARTYVVTSIGIVVGYYCLATGAVQRNDTLKAIRHGLPDPVPVIVIGRLATDNQHKGKGIGGALLKDALLRSAEVSKSIGARAVLVHAIDNDATTFYLPYGFKAFPADSRTLFLPIEHIKGVL